MPSVPDPENVKPWYLRNITEALALDEATGNVFMRTGTAGGSLIAAPWNLQVAMGQIPGVTGLSISGYNGVVATEFVPLWDNSTGTYTYFPSAQPVRVWSSSASDTDVTVLVTGLDASYNVITETIHLTAGTTGVPGTKNFLRVNSANLTKTPMNAGVISVGNSDKTITLTTIEIGSGRSQMTIYTVPAGYTFYLTQSNWYTNQTGSQTALYRSWTRNAAGVVNIVLTFPLQQQYNSTKIVPRPYLEKTDIQWQAQSSSGTSKIGGQIEGYLISNTLL
jgi:hypothetical protein